MEGGRKEGRGRGRVRGRYGNVREGGGSNLMIREPMHGVSRRVLNKPHANDFTAAWESRISSNLRVLSAPLLVSGSCPVRLCS